MPYGNFAYKKFHSMKNTQYKFSNGCFSGFMFNHYAHTVQIECTLLPTYNYILQYYVMRQLWNYYRLCLLLVDSKFNRKEKINFFNRRLSFRPFLREKYKISQVFEHKTFYPVTPNPPNLKNKWCNNKRLSLMLLNITP